MPRIYDKDGDPWDYCVLCFPSEEETHSMFLCGETGLNYATGGSSYDAEHPLYEKVDYHCDRCKCTLDRRDN